MSSFQVWVLHHRGLFYERPIRVYRHQEICEEEYNFVDRKRCMLTLLKGVQVQLKYLI